MAQLSVRHGSSSAGDAVEAAKAFIGAVAQPGIELVVFFCAPRFVQPEVAALFAREFPARRVIGCSTAGEIGPEGYQSDSITGFSISGDQLTATLGLLDKLDSMSLQQGSEQVQALLECHRNRGFPLDAHRNFAFLLIDGLSMREELVSAAVFQNGRGIPLFGGSAGDDLAFERSHVYYDGAFRSNAAVVALFHTELPFRVFSYQQFSPTPHKLVVTEADPVHRVVSEFNAEPAALAYADLIGVPRRALGPAVFACHPVTVRVGGRDYVRSIQKANDDDSLTFYCAIDEGLVLTLAEGVELAENLESSLRQIRDDIGQPALVVGCDCILRRAAMNKETRADIERVLQGYGVVGFCTYGEQINGIHVNQTLAGVAIGIGRSGKGS